MNAGISTYNETQYNKKNLAHHNYTDNINVGVFKHVLKCKSNYFSIIIMTAVLKNNLTTRYYIGVHNGKTKMKRLLIL